MSTTDIRVHGSTPMRFDDPHDATFTVMTEPSVAAELRGTLCVRTVASALRSAADFVESCDSIRAIVCATQALALLKLAEAGKIQ